MISDEPSALLELLSYCFPCKEESTGNLGLEPCVQLLKTANLSQHETLIAAVTEQLEPLDGIAPSIYSQLRYCDQLFVNYCQGHKLDPAVNQSLRQLLPLIAEAQLLTPKWSWEQHPVMSLFNLMQSYCIGWQPINRASERFLTQVNDAIGKLLNDWRSNHLDYSDNALTQLFEKEKQRLNKLEQRVKEAEKGTLKAKRAQDLSVKIINDKMQGKVIPAAVVQFLQSHWHDSLILLLVNSDNLQAKYHRLNKLTETLIWTFQPFEQGDNDTQQKIYRLIGSLQQELNDNTVSLKHQPEKLEQVLASIEAEHLKILKGETVTGSEFTPLENTNPLNAGNTKISGTLIKKVGQIKEGQWFSHDMDDQQQRIKLLIKLSDSQQLLFSNHSGIKACQYSFEELAYKLSNNSIKPLPDQCRIEQTASLLLENLIKIQQQKQQKIAAHEAEQQRLQQEQAKREQARLKALAEAQALKKQQAEAEQQRQALKPAVKQPEISFSDQQRYSVQLHQFSVGGIMRFNRSGQNRDCKLAAITEQGNKFIFVNQQGVKDCEIMKQELIVQLATKQASIIDQGSNFEDALSKVVSSIRDKNNRNAP